jgi:hypothetical protein
MHIGDAGVEEPMWVYLSFMRRAQREQWFVEHPIGVREITGLARISHQKNSKGCRFVA